MCFQIDRMADTPRNRIVYKVLMRARWCGLKSAHNTHRWRVGDTYELPQLQTVFSRDGIMGHIAASGFYVYLTKATALRALRSYRKVQPGRSYWLARCSVRPEDHLFTARADDVLNRATYRKIKLLGVTR